MQKMKFLTMQSKKVKNKCTTKTKKKQEEGAKTQKLVTIVRPDTLNELIDTEG